MKLTIELPDLIATQFGTEPKEASRRVLEDATVEGYRAGRWSQRQVAAILDADFWQTEKFLRDRHVLLNYSAGDLEKDGNALYKVFTAQ